MRHPVFLMSRMIPTARSNPHESAEQRRRRALRAATTVARAHGLDVRHPRVLADDNNTIVHLRPAQVVAKVATTWIRDGPDVLARELSVAMHVARRGGPIPPPAEDLPARLHHHDGLAMTFWRYVECATDGPPPTVTTGSLRRLHAALADYPDRLPSFRMELDELLAALADPGVAPTLDDDDRTFLRRTFRSLLADLDRHDHRARALHGDPHEGNRMVVEGDVLWVDLEAVCVGPLEWDLSALDQEDAALFDEADPGMLALMRDLRSCRVAALCWMQRGRARAVDEAAEWHLGHLKSLRGAPNGRPMK
jgi:hypothetical protein